MKPNKYADLLNFAEILANSCITKTPRLRLIEKICGMDFDTLTKQAVLQRILPSDPSEELRASHLAVVAFDFHMQKQLGMSILPETRDPLHPQHCSCMSELYALRGVLDNLYMRQLAIENRQKEEV